MQQPWVSSSPIDGNFHFVAPVSATTTSPTTPSLSETEAAWAAIKDTKDPTQVEAFIQRYGNNQLYADLAWKKRDELKVAIAEAIVALKQQFGRAVLYDEDPSDPKGKQFVGTVVWRTEPI